MNRKQKKFCEEYLIDLNAEQAAIRSGYSPRYARGNAHKLVANSCIQDQIQKCMDERSKRTEVTQDEVIKGIMKIAFANATDYEQVATNELDQVVVIKDTDLLSDEQKAAIKSIKQGRHGIEVELYDKLKALELLGKHLGLFKDKIELSGQVNNPFEGLTTDELKKVLGLT